ncbi:MAG: phosphoserine phosphatase SerB [Parvularculales bacterium]
MKYIMTLIGRSDSSALNDKTVMQAAATVQGAGEPRWLAPHKACDIPFNTPAPSEALAAVQRVLKDLPLDVVVQPTGGRRKKLLLADMDSTIIEQECLDEIAEKAGLGDKVASITRRSMTGEIEFEEALRTRVALLAGKPVSLLDDVWHMHITLTAGAHSLVATMSAHGATTALVSGGFTYFTNKIAKALGFDYHRANVLLQQNNCLTGKVEEPILGRDTKYRLLQEMRTSLGLTPEEIVAVGDGANDLDMVRGAGLGIAFHAKPILETAASACIRHNDLTALLYIQGYTAEEIITPS